MKTIKNIILIIFSTSITNITAYCNNHNTSKYEGSVYVSYFYETTGGLSTVHGARLAGDRWFLGIPGMRCGSGVPQGMDSGQPGQQRGTPS